MKIILKRIFNLYIILIFFSCRQIPENEKFESENVSLENLALVSINPIGIEWGNPLISANADEQGVSAWGGGNILIYSDLQPVSATNRIDIFNDLQSAKSSISAGVRYVVVAFDYKTGNTVDSMIYTVGSIPKPLKLSIGKKYDLVIYSFNSSEAPPRVSSINDRLSYEYSDKTKEFLYRKISEYIPGRGISKLDVVLRHRFSYVKFILDRSGFIGDIDSLDSKLSNAHYKSGRININTGNFIGDSYSDVYIHMKSLSENLYESEYIPIVLEPGKKRSTFILEIAAMTVQSIEKKIKNLSVDIKPGTRHTYTIKLTGNSMTMPTPVRCEDSNADNYEDFSPCKYTPKCTDSNAMNTGKALPCIYACTDPNATNRGQSQPCKYPPPPKCTDPDATNNGGSLPCQYPPAPRVAFGSLPKTYTPGTCCKNASNFCFNTYVNDYSITVSINNYDSKLHKVEVSTSGSASWVTSVLKQKSFSRNGSKSNTWTWVFGRHQYVSTDKLCLRPGAGSPQHLWLNVTIKSTKTGKVVATGTGKVELQN